MDATKAIEAACQVFLENLPDLAYNPKSQKIKVRKSTRYIDRPNVYKKLYRELTHELQAELFKLPGHRYLDAGVHDEEILGLMTVELIEREPETKTASKDKVPLELLNLDDLFITEAITCPLSRIKLILVPDAIRSSFLWNPDKDIQYPYDYEAIRDRLKNLFADPRHVPDWIRANSMDCVKEYRPFEERIIRDDDREVDIFNMWSPTKWAKDWEPQAAAAEAPPLFLEFMGHLFPDEVDRLSAMAWLRDATFQRAEPVLILCGRPGCGKTIFMMDLVGALVGLNNLHKAQRKFMESRFHDNIANCRAFVFDEHGLEKDQREMLKEYHTGIATLEKKGKDARGPEKIYASFILANNFAYGIRLDFNDRKFFTPRLAASSLENIWSTETIEHFLGLLKDDEFMRSIAGFLFANFAAGSSRKFQKTEFYRDLCLKNLPADLQAFRQACKKYQHFNNTRIKHPKINTIKLQEGLDNFEVTFGMKMATVVFAGDGTWSATSLIYEPSITLVKDLANGGQPGLD